ncbi:hypothetical protein PE36_16650 [Moritella sp. PE36]|nr:hypothetical protein PE36_16650 [Moritella sp. PE36]
MEVTNKGNMTGMIHQSLEQESVSQKKSLIIAAAYTTCRLLGLLKPC